MAGSITSDVGDYSNGGGNPCTERAENGLGAALSRRGEGRSAQRRPTSVEPQPKDPVDDTAVVRGLDGQSQDALRTRPIRHAVLRQHRAQAAQSSRHRSILISNGGLAIPDDTASNAERLRAAEPEEEVHTGVSKHIVHLADDFGGSSRKLTIFIEAPTDALAKAARL
jgi:hypothetical protein